MKKKSTLILLLAVFILLPAFNASAQQQSFSIFSFDLGFAPHYNFGNGTFRTDPSFALNVRVANPLTVSFGITGAAAANDTTLLRVKYDVLNQIRVLLAIGSRGANMVTGLGFEYIPFARAQNSFATEFKLGIEYLFRPQIGIDSGDLFFGLILGLGI